MANPFKEAEKKNKKAPGSAQESVVEKKEGEVTETPVEPEKAAETPKKPVVKGEEKKATPKKPEKKAAEPEKKAVDIFASLEAEKSTGKTYAFYLSEDNAKKLKEKAAKMGISTSKLLDHILSQVL